MKGTDLLILKAQLGIESNAELIRRLGISEGAFYDTLLRLKVSRPIRLAAAALVAGLEPYSPPQLTPEMILRIEATSAETLRRLAQMALDDPNLQRLHHPETSE